jgi:hypothetical protein
MWRLAGALDVVPVPPDPVLAGLIGDWWRSGPRSYGCRAARAARTGTIVAPVPNLWCPDCALRRFVEETRCLYCGTRVRRGRGNELVFEMRGGVMLLARAHLHCSEKAAKEAAT